MSEYKVSWLYKEMVTFRKILICPGKKAEEQVQILPQRATKGKDSMKRMN